LKSWWNVIYRKLKCAAFVLKLEKACGTLIFPLPSCPSYLASGCTYYPWLFCYLYCDVCIIDQNNIDITKKMHFEDIKGSPFRSQTNGSRNLEYKYIIWCIFILPHVWLPETLSLKTFQYNYPIFKYGLTETELCTFCSETVKSLLYLFWACLHSKEMVFISKCFGQLWFWHASYTCT
jgi:hypothetical protein